MVRAFGHQDFGLLAAGVRDIGSRFFGVLPPSSGVWAAVVWGVGAGVWTVDIGILVHRDIWALGTGHWEHEIAATWLPHLGE